MMAAISVSTMQYASILDANLCIEGKIMRYFICNSILDRNISGVQHTIELLKPETCSWENN